MLGSMVRKDAGVAREVAAAGHEIGVHGDVHGNMLRRTPRRADADIARRVRHRRRRHGHAAPLVPAAVRHPVGRIVALGAPPRHAHRAVDHLGPRLAAARRRPRPSSHDVLRRYVDGGTVLLHDSDCTSYPGSWRSALGALPRLADELSARGLTVGPVGDHGL